MRLGVVLFQLGGPDSIGAIEPFLYNLFCDPDIIDFPLARIARQPLARLIASSRAKHVAGHYREIGGRSPILDYTTRQANALVLEGALPQEVDKVIYDFGFPMGPFAMGDLAGLDVGWRIRKRRAAEGKETYRGYILADRLCERGRFGQKTKAGWYRYEADSRTPLPDPVVEDLVESTAAELGIKRRRIEPQEILERCLFPLVNEGAKILAEGLALRASDIDIIWINGYGFPAYRGGPMFYADQVGLAKVHEVMRRLHEEHGEILRTAPLLERLAKEGKRFRDL